MNIYWQNLAAQALKELFSNLPADIQEDLSLTSLPYKIDFLVHFTEEWQRSNNPIAKYFRKFNVIEFKAATETFTPNVYNKTMVYLYMHQLSFNEEDYLLNDYTLTLLSGKYTRNLIKSLKKRGLKVVENDPIEGIYQIKGEKVPIQIVCLNKIKDVEVLYPFTPLVPENVRSKLNLIGFLLKKCIDNPENKTIWEIWGFCVENCVLTQKEYKEVMKMFKKERGHRKELYLKILRESEVGKIILESGETKGKIEGKIEGKVEGKVEGIEEVTINAFRIGLDEESISQMTGFPPERLMELKEVALG